MFIFYHPSCSRSHHPFTQTRKVDGSLSDNVFFLPLIWTCRWQNLQALLSHYVSKLFQLSLLNLRMSPFLFLFSLLTHTFHCILRSLLQNHISVDASLFFIYEEIVRHSLLFMGIVSSVFGLFRTIFSPFCVICLWFFYSWKHPLLFWCIFGFRCHIYHVLLKHFPVI